MIIRKGYLILSVLIALTSCKPEIYSFSASPKVITDIDSVHLSWKVRGTPVVSFHQKKVLYFNGDSVQLLQFVLVAIKGKQKTAPRTLEMVVLPKHYRDTLVFSVTSHSGDTLMAAGVRDSLYKDFQIDSMASVDSRKILVQHEVYETMLYDSSVRSKTLRGLDYFGGWKLQSLMTPEERDSSKLSPDSLKIAVYIKPKKP